MECGDRTAQGTASASERLRQAEEEIGRLQRLVGELEALAETARNVARIRHDINNPLTAIAGLAELLLMKEQGLTAEGQGRLRMIIENCTRISGHLKQMKPTPVDAAAAAPSPGART